MSGSLMLAVLASVATAGCLPGDTTSVGLDLTCEGADGADPCPGEVFPDGIVYPVVANIELDMSSTLHSSAPNVGDTSTELVINAVAIDPVQAAVCSYPDQLGRGSNGSAVLAVTLTAAGVCLLRLTATASDGSTATSCLSITSGTTEEPDQLNVGQTSC